MTTNRFALLSMPSVLFSNACVEIGCVGIRWANESWPRKRLAALFSADSRHDAVDRT
jgi:hypothetical protein